MLVVSLDFADVAGARRGRPLRDAWDYTQYGSVDVITYTPAEYDAARDRAGRLISTADTEGIHVVGPAPDTIYHTASDHSSYPNAAS